MLENSYNCGTCNGNYKHGMSWHPLYHVWRSMKQRCGNPKDHGYLDYGDRGISVYPPWLKDPIKFINWCFLNGWVEGLQLDRIDNDNGYEPENCRFVTPLTNAHNRRAQQNTTGWPGVSVNRQGKYYGRRTYKYKTLCTKVYSTPKEAYIATFKLNFLGGD